MSYEEVEKLLSRIQGRSILSDQSIWNRVTQRADSISEQLSQDVEEILKSNQTVTIEVNSDVDIYDSNETEILLFDDGIQVKGQQEYRRKSRNAEGVDILPSQEDYTKAPRVNTDVVILEKAPGDFEYIVAPLVDDENTRPSLVEVIKAKVIQAYGHQETPLNIVAITDGAKAIRLRLLSIFTSAVVIILDWYHLGKKVRELMSMIARNKQEKSDHLKFLFYHLWRGETQVVIEYLQQNVKAKNLDKLNELLRYIQKHETEIINYERRQKAGKTIGSGRAEKGVDRVVGYRQKKKGMSWRTLGSHSLALLKVLELNGQWQQFWFPNASVT
ncbi:MAG: hypothetical protein AAGC93_30810 [Cyanobacteria bacterium P01_F01_bin.53]